MQLKFLKTIDNDSEMVFYVTKGDSNINCDPHLKKVDEIEYIRGLTASVLQYLQGETVANLANGWLISISPADVHWAELKLKIIHKKSAQKN